MAASTLVVGERGLSVIEFGAPYDFFDYQTYTVLPTGSAPEHLDATDPVFSADGNYLYFSAQTDTMLSGLFRVLATGGTPLQLHGDGELLRRAYHPSVSPNGRYVIFSSEMWKEDPTQFSDEELLQLDLLTGAVTQLTREAGNQYGYFARNGTGEFLMLSSPSPGAKFDLFRQQHETRVPVYTADPLKQFQEHSPSWWKKPTTKRNLGGVIAANPCSIAVTF